MGWILILQLLVVSPHPVLAAGALAAVSGGCTGTNTYGSGDLHLPIWIATVHVLLPRAQARDVVARGWVESRLDHCAASSTGDYGIGQVNAAWQLADPIRLLLDPWYSASRTGKAYRATQACGSRWACCYRRGVRGCRRWLAQQVQPVLLVLAVPRGRARSALEPVSRSAGPTAPTEAAGVGAGVQGEGVRLSR